MGWTPPPPPRHYEGGYYSQQGPIVSVEELMEIYPDLKEMVDKYTEWEILKRSTGPDSLDDLI